MKESPGSNVVNHDTPAAGATISVQELKRSYSRPTILSLITIIAAVICAASASVASADTRHAVAIVYLGFTMAMLACAWAFLTRGRIATGALHIRWSLISAAALAAGVGYAPSIPELLFNFPPQRVFQTACFNSSEALFLLAAVLFFAGGSRLTLVVDALQAMLFILLRFNLVYSPVSRDHFTLDHLLIGQLVALFLFLVAIVAGLGAASDAEVKFLRILSAFFGLRMVALFLSNQVSYTWLHHEYCSELDVVGTMILFGFALCILYAGQRDASPTRQAIARSSSPLHTMLRCWLDGKPRASSLHHHARARTPSIMVRSLMPSFLALVNLFLALFLLRTSVELAAIAISLSLVCYVLRTALLQSQNIRDKAFLQTLNEQLQGLAMRDPLTGIGNRRSLAEIYQRMQDESAGQGLSILLMDIDQFKQANDTHGHLYGDRVLITLARTLEALASRISGSHSVRLGGDEFALLLPDTAPHVASLLAEELRTNLCAHDFKVHNKQVSLSIGIASLQGASDLPLETLVLHADKALYRAKQLGRDRVEIQPVWETEAASIAPTAHLELQHTA